MVETDLPVSNANVDIYVKDKTSGERFFVKSTTSDSLGNYKTRLQPDQDYFVVIKKKLMIIVDIAIPKYNVDTFLRCSL